MIKKLLFYEISKKHKNEYILIKNTKMSKTLKHYKCSYKDDIKLYLTNVINRNIYNLIYLLI